MDNDATFVGRRIARRYLVEDVLPGSSVNTAVCTAADERGGAGVVVRLTRTSSLVDVMSGVPDRATAVEEFQRRMLAVGGLSHPVLVAPLDWGEHVEDGESWVFVITERLGGASVRELLDRGRRFSVSQAVVVGLDVCRALHHLHAAGIVHGDIRPAHVFVGADARARLTGIGTKRPASAETMGLEQSRYASPEVAAGATHESASDVYSLSLMLLEMVTGEVPFAADSVTVALANRIGRLLPVSADVGALAAPLERAARPEPADRSTALDFGRALAAVAAKVPAPEPVEGVVTERFRDVVTRQMQGITSPIPRPAAGVDAGVEAAPSSSATSAGASSPLDAATAADATVSEASPRSRRRRRLVIAACIVAVVAIVGVARVVLRPVHAVPDLVALAEGEARNAISQFGWRVVVQAERSDDVEAGRVIRTVPPVGTDVRSGGEFVLVVSAGPRLAVLPEVGGLSRDDAIAALRDAGLVVAQVDEPSDSVAAGVVVSWIVTEQPSLTAGREVLKGTVVQINVSSGPAIRTMPDLVSRTEADALAIFASLEVVATRGEDVFSSTVPVGAVAVTDPPTGAQFERGAAVTYALSKGPELVALPRIVGLGILDAERVLNDAGLVIGTTTGRSTGKIRSATLAGSAVNSGDLVPKGSAIDVVFP
jgi:beta-lactam-binding protein with PASTA domain